MVIVFMSFMLSGAAALAQDKKDSSDDFPKGWREATVAQRTAFLKKTPTVS